MSVESEKDWVDECSDYLDSLRSKPKSASELYTLLKSRMTGQVINGVLKGCLLESELEEIYEQFIGQSNFNQPSTDGN
jgi:translation initiation factor 2 beta subunit (eIF-2beta)/eIF-5